MSHLETKLTLEKYWRCLIYNYSVISGQLNAQDSLEIINEIHLIIMDKETCISVQDGLATMLSAKDGMLYRSREVPLCLVAPIDMEFGGSK